MFTSRVLSHEPFVCAIAPVDFGYCWLGATKAAGPALFVHVVLMAA